MKLMTRVLVVDDSPVFCRFLSAALGEDPDLNVVGTAFNAYEARDAIVKLQPDVLTLDVNMPRMNGIEFLEKLMPQYPIPVVMVSSETRAGHESTLRALEAGAVDFVEKPSCGTPQSKQHMVAALRTKLKIASKADVTHWKKKWDWRKVASINPQSNTNSEKKVIVIGASTGGTDALRKVICGLPRGTPGVVVVQHMPPGFSAVFAERLNQQAQMLVKEAQEGDKVRPGQVLIAPGGYQTRLKGLPNGRLATTIKKGPLVCGHQPSVEVLMQSAAECAGSNAVGVMLTGMGNDGAEGMAAMRRAGARTIAQSEDSCVVFGMPREAQKAGGVERMVHLQEISANILRLIQSVQYRRVA